jgi:LysR family transcriptional regulator, hydrogen peroxide-inducible genes activator
MRRFTSAWPNVDVELHESHYDVELGDLVERGILDVAFVQLPLDNAWLETELLLEDDYVLVTAAGSPFGAKRIPTLREIASQPLIGYRSCSATELVVDQIRAAGGIEPHFVFRSDENGVVQGLARSGIGVAVLPRLALDPNDAEVRITSLSPRVASRQIAIARHKDRYHSAAARAFMTTALEVGAEAADALSAVA